MQQHTLYMLFIPSLFLLLLVPFSARGLEDSQSQETPVQTGETAGPSHTTSTLLLRVAQDAQHRDLEKKFLDALQMAMDELVVIPVAAPVADFAQLSLNKQLELVQPVMGKHNTVVAIWIVQQHESITLQCVEASSGRASARLVEIKKVKGVESDLATAAMELIEAVVPAAPPPVTTHATTADTVPTRPKQQPKQHPWRVGLSSRFSGGIYGDYGPNRIAGGLLLTDRTLGKLLNFRIFTGGFGGYLDSTSVADIQTLGVYGGVGILLQWRLKSLVIGPALELQMGLWRMTANSEDKTSEAFNHFSFSGTVLLESTWWFAKRYGILVGGGAAFYTKRWYFERMAIDEMVLRTPFIAWEARFGLVFKI